MAGLSELFGMNDSQQVQRLTPEGKVPEQSEALTKPPVDINSLPLAERLRIQAQQRAEQAGGNDQNVGPVS